ncbi:hypothetical protein [Cohnella hongkongensis]|uniref:Carboxypeptidase regulatory-like domain-containing protein n=1 Tax=Cohnella hongkongensis TaxID=178337 RepID=A0ABV9FHG1_9BACL
MDRAERTFVTRCSLAVRPFDIWTGTPPVPSSLNVSLEGIERKPIRSSDGSYVFLDVPGDRCTVKIESATYRDVREPVDLSAGGVPPIVTVSLLPGRTYAPPAAGTGAVVELLKPDGSPLAGAEIRAYIDEEAAVRGRLAEERGEGAGLLLKVAPSSGRLAPGDAFVLKDRDGSEPEWNRMADWTEQPSVIVLDRPLRSGWSRGTRLLPAVRATTDASGCAILPFRGLLPAVCRMEAEIRSEGSVWRTTWEAEGGAVARLPAFTVGIS